MQTYHARRSRGFTLVELIITMVIVALLLSIAVPTYQSQIRKSRRTEAKTALLDLAGREERLYGINNAYSSVPSALGYGTSAAPLSVDIGGGYFHVDVASTATTFTITATAKTTDQLKDTACRTFTVDEKGVQGAKNSSSVDNTATCWR